MARIALGLLGGIAVPLLLAASVASGQEVETVVLLTMLLIGCVAGEVLERYLFFAASTAPRMPGGIR